MSSAKQVSKIVAITSLVLVLGVAGWVFLVNPDEPPATGVKMPTLSPMAQAGARAFEATCAECHGMAGLGTDKGPPFLHQVYNPGHHSDEAFRRAVRQGVKQHHWPFGNMPAQPQVTDRQITEIVRYVRELQDANGIVAQPHIM